MKKTSIYTSLGALKSITKSVLKDIKAEQSPDIDALDNAVTDACDAGSLGFTVKKQFKISVAKLREAISQEDPTEQQNALSYEAAILDQLLDSVFPQKAAA